MRLRSRLKLFISFIAISILFGCTPPKPKTDIYLYPVPNGPEGYSIASGEAVYENKSIKITVKQLRAGSVADPFIKSLIKKDYIVLRFTIDNRSGEKVIYNPVYTVLTDDEMDYRKPLDFTDLYDVAREEKGSTEDDSEKKVAALRGKFYDVIVTIPPGEKTSRFLIFKPLSNEIKKADLAIKEIYIGTETERLSFPFTLDDPAEMPVKKTKSSPR